MLSPRAFLACALSSVGVLLALLSLSASPQSDADQRLVQPLPSSGENVTESTRASASLRRPTGFSPNTIAINDGATLSDIVCPSASDCWAVGYFHAASGGDRTLIEHWDGGSWSIVPSPNRSNYSELFSVTCNSASDCWAVGPQKMMVHWNGISWSLVESPADYTSAVYGVTCASSSDCWAVGNFYNSGLGRQQTLVEHWDGVSWSIVSSPNASNGQCALDSVTCASASDCWSVGSVGSVGGNGALIVHWNGISWSLVNSPSVGGTLRGVTCASASQCWAVGGSYVSPSLIEKWDGISWTIASGAVTDFLEAVRCNSASDCWGVGFTANFDWPLVEHWNGNAWIFFSAPVPPEFATDTLHGVSCLSPSDCWAVGDRNDSLFKTLIEHWDGVSWSVVTGPPVFNSVVSRMTHGSAGAFDVDLHRPGNECRRGGIEGNYQLVLNFLNDLTNVRKCITTAGAVSSSSIGPNPNQYTVNLTGVPNAQSVTVTLKTAQDTLGNSGNVSTRMDLLLGDTNGDGHVDASDIAQTKSSSGQQVTSINFRSDVNADGRINASDIALVKSTVGSAFP